MTFNEAIQKYQEWGFKIFPLHYIKDGECSCGKAGCSSQGKHPMTQSGVKDASGDADIINGWVKKYGTFNIGIATDNLCVIDIDRHNGVNGEESFRGLAEQYGELPVTLQCYTGGGGIHAYFRLPEGCKIGNRVGVAPGVDIRSAGGYVVAPPSNHISGNLYKWATKINTKIEVLPKKWAFFLTDGNSVSAKKSPKAVPQEISSGGRNNILFSLACSLQVKGLDDNSILEAVKSENTEKCRPPLSEQEVVNICSSALKYKKGNYVTAEGETDVADLPQNLLFDEAFLKELLTSVKGQGNSLKLEAKLEYRAKQLSCSKQFNKLLKAIKHALAVEHAESIKSTEEPEESEELFSGYNTGEWRCGKDGLRLYEGFPPIEVYVCSQPVIINKLLRNVEDQNYKAEVYFKKNGRIITFVVGKNVISSRQSIVALSDKGLDVNSENARYMVKYFTDFERLNKLPENESTSKLGWTKDGFTPYTGDRVFDGEATFREIFDAVTTAGDMQKWCDCYKEQKNNPIVRVFMAASVASILLKKTNRLNFITHIWGQSGFGKTVALQFAASIWGKPEHICRTFNATLAGSEALAGLFNNLPLILDEQMTVNEKYQSLESIIYNICQGEGRTRSTVNRGLQTNTHWNLAILTTGEKALTADNSGSGAKNRVIEINCISSLFQNPVGVVKVYKSNYGHAGKRIVEWLLQGGLSKLNLYEFDIRTACSCLNEKLDSKQLVAFEAICLGDVLLNYVVCGSTLNEAIEDIQKILVPWAQDNLADKKEISLGVRVESAIRDWIAVNKNNFINDDNESVFTPTPFYGNLRRENKESWAYIIADPLKEFLRIRGFDWKAAMSELKEREIIKCNHGYLCKLKKDGRTENRIAFRLTDNAVPDKSVQIDIGNYNSS